MNKVSALKIYETDEYGKFKFTDWNRNVNIQLVKALALSIAENGYIGSPIVVNEFNEVIDGQHRLKACEQTHTPIPYIIRKGVRMKEAIALNSKQSQWTTRQFIAAYVANGSPEQKRSYGLLDRLLVEYGQMVDVTFCAVKGVMMRGVQKTLASGDLVITDKEYKAARDTLDYLSRFDEYSTYFGDNKRGVLTALVKLKTYGLIDEDRMVEQFEKYGERYTSSSKVMDNIRALNELYNLNRKVKDYFVDKYRSLAGE